MSDLGGATPSSAKTAIVAIVGSLDAPSPLLRSLPAIDDLIVVSVGDGPETAGTRPGMWSLEDLDLPGPTLRFCLSVADRAAVARPRIVQRLLEAHDEILVIAGNVHVREWPLFDGPAAGVEVVPELALAFATTKPSLEAAIEVGAGRAVTSVIRFEAATTPRNLIAEWAEWTWRHHVRGPGCDVAAAERDLVSAWPGLWREARFCHEPVLARWSDLHPEVPWPRAVDLDGLREYRETEGPALELIGRRTHALGAVETLQAEIGELPPEPAVLWSDGVGVADLARDLIRALDPAGRRWADPGNVSVRDWLETPHGVGLPRFARALYWSRPDLRVSYPADTPVRVLTDFLAEHGVGLSERSVARDAPSVAGRVTRKLGRVAGGLAGRREPTLGSPRPRAGSSSDGVNVIGYLRAQSGLGEAARATVRALQHLGIPVSVVDVSHRVYSRHQPLDDVPETGTPFDFTVVHLNPEELLGYAHDDLRYRLGADRVIGAWFWETDEVPASWLPAFDVVDELWVASEFLATTFGKHTDKDIVRVGLPVDLPEDVTPDRARFGIPTDAFVVTYVTDAYSGWDRKNPLAAVEAFRGAFADDPGAHLLLKISNLEKFPSHAQELSAALTGVNATVIGEYLDRDTLWQLLACSDVYLSLHASEGFGLTVIEAMALGVPVIATAYGGTMDFTTPETALLVDYDLVAARGGPGGAYSGNGQWARPDLAQASAHLKTLRANPSLAHQLGEAGRRTAATASAEAQARRIAARLEILTLGQPASSDSAGFHPTTA